MLRITLRPVDDSVVIQLEGCLAGAWVAELETCWHEARARHEGRVKVDLRSVCHVDGSGRDLMSAMHAAGAVFVASGCLIPEIVREVTEPAGAASCGGGRN